MESWLGMKSDCFVRQLTMTRMEEKPLESGSCSIKFKEMESHGQDGMGSCFKRP